MTNSPFVQMVEEAMLDDELVKLRQQHLDLPALRKIVISRGGTFKLNIRDRTRDQLMYWIACDIVEERQQKQEDE